MSDITFEVGPVAGDGVTFDVGAQSGDDVSFDIPVPGTGVTDHGGLTGRNAAGQHTSDAVTIGGESLTDYLTGLKVFHPDVAFHPVNTSGAYPESDIDPINDTAAWVTAGGPAFFNVSTGDVVAINNTDFDPTTTGIYNWNGTTFTRHPDYVTTASLDTLLVISDVHHSHFSGVPLATAIPLAAMFFADDIDAPLGTAEFVTKIFPDGDTVIDLITYLGGGGVALGETSTTAYRGDRGKTAYDYSQAHTGATDPHGDRAYAAALVDDLSGVTSASTARTNLGLGTLATASTVTTSEITDATIVAEDLAASLAARIPTTVQLGSDQSVTSQQTLQNITGLSFAVTNGSTYYIDGLLYVTGATAADLRVGFTCPAGTVKIAVYGMTNIATGADGTVTGNAVIQASGGEVSTLGTLTGSEHAVIVRGYFACTTSGTFQMQHAQRTSTASATTVKAGSFITYHS